MLLSLYIKNIALIDTLEVGFSPGLNILTGETGAGKSIIIDAVNLALGERADRELVKAGSEKAAVEAVFDIAGNEQAALTLSELGFEAEDGLLPLARELYANGRSVCRVCGRIVTSTILKQVSETLIDVHGQHEHQVLLNPSRHRTFLDAFAGNDALAALKEVGTLYERHREIVAKIEKDYGSDAERERRIDMLKWQINEIKAARLVSGEEAALEIRLKVLRNGENILSALSVAYEALYSGDAASLSQLRTCADSLGRIADLSEEYGGLYGRLDEAYYTLEDAAERLRDLKNGFEYDPSMLEEVETRLNSISRLKRKYGGSEDAAIAYLASAEEELYTLENSAQILEKLKKEERDVFRALYESAAVLSDIRRASSSSLSKAVEEQLRDLGMLSARFEVFFEPAPKQSGAVITRQGFDKAEFLLSANAGEPPRPLAKVASGGEMSRIMLALKNIGAFMHATPVMVFDEIDAGISGKIAQAVAHKMIEISRQRQVICVTHLPQIACAADTHYLIEKKEEESTVKTLLYPLDDEGRKKEIARLTSGERISDAGLVHAAELLKAAGEYKAQLKSQ